MNANKTVKQFSWGKAVVFLILVSLFYLASGFGELLESIIQEEGIKGGGLAVDQYFFAHLYWEYLFYLSWITMITGVLLLFRLNFARVAAIAIAWWNIFTGPLIDVWRQMFYMKINKLVIVDTSPKELLFTIAIIGILILIRLLIIYLLKRSKPGCMSIIQSLKK